MQRDHQTTTHFAAYRSFECGLNRRCGPSPTSWFPGTKCIGTLGDNLKMDLNRRRYSSYLPNHTRVGGEKWSAFLGCLSPSHEDRPRLTLRRRTRLVPNPSYR